MTRARPLPFKTAGIINLGCSRNVVDGEIVLGQFRKAGLRVVNISADPDILIINTCSFIRPAREESIDMIMQAIDLKSKRKVKKIIVCGCLPQLYKEKLSRELPEADLIVGTSDFPSIISLLRDRNSRKTHVSDARTYLYDDTTPRLITTAPHCAYVKIAEGCDNYCSYCIIARLRGAFRSRSVGSIIKEVTRLSSGGRLREIILTGQDTTMFGVDRYGKQMLPLLLECLDELKTDIRWIRLMYTHPAHFEDRLIKTIRDTKKVCKYVDLPVQHCNDRILKAMNRHTTKEELTRLVESLRKTVPGIALRTSIIVGFPGETDREFKELCDFVKETAFDRLGAFVYSKEAGTKAGRMPGQISEKVKGERLAEIMRIQQGISLARNERLVGKRRDVLIDERSNSDRGVYVGRTYADAPEVDNTVDVAGKDLKVGEIYPVKITKAFEYDIAGEVV